MKNDVQTVKNIIETFEVNDHLDIVNYVSVWSNGKKIRRFVGQNENSEWHNPEKGYKKMVAILVEIEE